MKLILILLVFHASDVWSQRRGAAPSAPPILSPPSTAPASPAPASSASPTASSSAMVVIPNPVSPNLQTQRLKPSFWMRNCKARFSTNMAHIQTAFEQNRLQLSAAKSPAERAEIRASTILLNIFNKVAQAPMEMKELQAYPASIPEDSGDPRIANAYNQFAVASKDFHLRFQAKHPEGGVANDVCSARRVSGARNPRGYFAYQIATTKRFLLGRYMLSKYANEALAALEKPPIRSPQENAHVATLIKIALAVAVDDIQACPLRVWQASRERFLQFKGDPTQACSVPELVSFKASASPKFDLLINSLRVPDASPRPALTPRKEEVQIPREEEDTPVETGGTGTEAE